MLYYDSRRVATGILALVSCGILIFAAYTRHWRRNLALASEPTQLPSLELKRGVQIATQKLRLQFLTIYQTASKSEWLVSQ